MAPDDGHGDGTGSERSFACADCGGTRFEDGFVEEARSMQGQVRWLAGVFEQGALGRLTGRLSRPRSVITAYRCVACGRLALYAFGDGPGPYDGFDGQTGRKEDGVL